MTYIEVRTDHPDPLPCDCPAAEVTTMAEAGAVRVFRIEHARRDCPLHGAPLDMDTE